MKVLNKKLYLPIFVILLVAILMINTCPVFAATEVWAPVGSLNLSTDTAEYPNIQLDSTGTPYIAYLDTYNYPTYQGGYEGYTIKKFNGSSWDLVFNNMFITGYNYIFKIAPDNTPYIAYINNNSNKVNVLKYNEATSSLAQVGQPDFSAGAVQYMSFTIAKDGTLYVAYRDDANSGKLTVMMYDGIAWGLVGTAGFSPDTVYYTTIATDSIGTPYVVYLSGSKSTVIKYNGTDWESIGDFIGEPRITLDSTDKLYVSYTKSEFSFSDMRNVHIGVVASYNGTGWNPVGDLGFAYKDIGDLTVYTDNNNVPYILFIDSNFKPAVMKYDSSGNWISVGNPGFSPGNSTYASMVINKQSKPFVIYQDNFNNNRAAVYSITSGCNLNYTAGVNGSISGALTQAVANGGNGSSVTAVPATGYHFEKWSDNSTNNPRTDSNVTQDISVSASFAINSCTLSYTAGNHGSISGAKSQSVNYGDSGSEVTAEPDTGYYFVQWSDGSKINPRTDANVTTDINVSAVFNNTYGLTYAAGSNGTISGTDSQTVSYGNDGSEVTAVPNTGYHFVQWSDSSTDNPRTDTDVSKNISVNAVFAINTYTLKYDCGAHGIIKGPSTQTVNYGDSGSQVLATPDNGYHFIQWNDGSTDNPRTDTNVTDDLNVSAGFVINTYTLSYNAGSHGTISGTASQTVDYKESGSKVTAVPDTGYHFVQWSDGSTVDSRTDTNVTDNMNLSASFAKNTYTLTYTAGSHGTISGTASQTVEYGDNGLQVTAVPDPGYKFAQWSDGSKDNPRTESNVSKDINVTAIFSNLTITYDGNGNTGGTVPVDENTYITGADIKVLSNNGTLTKSGYTFAGWNTAANGSGTSYNPGSTINMGKTNITLYARWTVNITGGGGGGSGTPVVVPPTDTNNPGTITDGNAVTSTTTVAATTDNSGKAATTVTQQQMNNAIDNAVSKAESQGQGTAAKVEIKVEAPENAAKVETSIPTEAVNKAVNNGINAITVTTPVAAITFDDKSLSTISSEASDTVKITASKVDTSAISSEAQQVVGDRPVFNFSVTSGDKTISQFGGNVSVSVPYTPKPGEDTNAIVIYYINSEGKPKLVNNCIYNPSTGSITFNTNHFSQYAVGYNKVDFKDVPADAWYSNPVAFIAARGITTGSGNGSFGPNEKLTRGQFIVMLMKAYGITPDISPKDNFADAGNTWYTAYLATAKRLGISAGVGNNLFTPEKEITRQEMFTLLYNGLKVIGKLPQSGVGKSTESFSDDSEIAPWAKDAINLFVETGTISGGGNKLSPKDNTTRAQMAQVLYSLLSK